MSGSEFERENIVTDALSADPASNPGEPAREHSWRPPAEGLYDLSLEKDSCGVGFIANIKGKKSRQIVSDALNILCNLEHRGAVGADPRAGDGAGILVQIPHAFFERKAAEIGFQLPKPGDYAVGALFMPKETAWRKVIKSIIADQIRDEGLMLLGWRDVPTDNSSLGETVKPTEPAHMQVFIGRGAHIKNADEFERRLYILRKSISQAIYQRRDRGLAGYYPVSLSCRTVVYKGMFLADQLGRSLGRLRVEKERIKTFAAEFDPQPFHLDEAAARDSIFRGLAASGWHTAALTMRLLVESELKPAGGIVGAGFDEFRWPRPVRPGDELHLESEVLEVRPSKSRPDQGLVKLRTTTLNQNGEAVQISVGNLVVPRRPA